MICRNKSIFLSGPSLLFVLLLLHLLDSKTLVTSIATDQPGPNTGFGFRWRYECIKSLEHQKHQKIGRLCSVLCLL